MRYRALGAAGQAVSALTLRLRGSAPRELRAPLATAALEQGINAFDLDGWDATLFDDIRPVLTAVDRPLLFVSVRLGVVRDGAGGLRRDFAPDRMVRHLAAIRQRSGLGPPDLALLEDPRGSELSLAALAALKDARSDGATRRLGVAGLGDDMDAYIRNGAFDVLATPFSLTSGWKERHRLKAAQGADMAVIGYGYYPEDVHRTEGAQVAGSGLFSRMLGRAPAPVQRPYAFLDFTADWEADDICLAYALTEPGLSSVTIEPATVSELEALATVPERELPSNLPAQIEMARFDAAEVA